MKISRVQMPQWLVAMPLASLTLAVIWVLLAAVVGLGFGSELSKAGAELRSVARQVIRTPELRVPDRLLPVAQDLMPGFESNEMFAFLRQEDGDDGGLQERFDERAAAALARFDRHPTRRLGLVPASLRPHAFFTHLLLHAGVIQALLTVLIFLLVAPPLERLWGSRRFVPAMMLIGLLGAGTYVLVHADADRALLGGGALVAGLAGAFLARFQAEEVDFLGWLPESIGAELIAPAWVLGAAWVLYEGAVWLSLPGGVPGLAHSPGWVAHASGAMLGVGIAMGLQRLGWEEQKEAPRPKPAAEPRLDLDRVRAMREAGEVDEALAALEAGVKRNARHRDAVTLYFEMCCERNEPERAAPALTQLIREELRRGADDVATTLWRQLVTHAPNARLDPPTLMRLTMLLREAGDDELAIGALELVLDRAELPGSVLAEVARTAAPISADVARKAALRALDDQTLGDGVRGELTALAGGAPDDDFKDDEVPVRPSGKELPPNVFFEGQDRSEFGALDDLSAVEDFPAGAVTEAVPRSLDLDGFVAVSDERGELTVDFSRVRAVSVVGVQGLGPKPVLLIDVLLDGASTERPLSVLRLRSDRFDPKSLSPGSQGGIEALRALVGQLLAGSEGLPLPDPQSAVLRPPKVYESLAVYEQEVLTPVGQTLG